MASSDAVVIKGIPKGSNAVIKKIVFTTRVGNAMIQNNVIVTSSVVPL